MNRKSIIKNFVAKNILPHQDLCPIIIQRWKDSKGNYIYWNSIFNTRDDSLEFMRKGIYNTREKDYVYSSYPISPRSRYDSFYAYYDKKNAMIELAHIYCLGNRGQNDVKKVWEYGNERYFLFKNDPTPYDVNGNTVFNDDNGKYYNKTFIKLFFTLNIFNNHFVIDEWKKYVDKDFYFYNGRKYDINWFYQIISSYKQIMERNIKKNPILDIELENSDNICSDMSNVNHEKIVFQKINDNFGVFRYFVYYTKDNKAKERLRIFIKNKKPTVCYKNEDEWRITSRYPSNFVCKNYDSDYNPHIHNEIENIDDAFSIKTIYWIKDLIDDSNIKTYTLSKLDIIVSALRHPMIEQLYKAGYKNIAKISIRQEGIDSTLKSLFNLEKVPKSIKDINLNKYILSEIDNCCVETHYNDAYIRNTHLIYYLDKILGRNILSHLNENDSKSWIKLITSMYHSLPLLQSNARFLNKYKYCELVISDYDKKIINKLRNIAIKDNQHDCSTIMNLYDDTIRIYRSIDNRPEIDFVNAISNYSDIERLHDNFVNLRNAQRNSSYEETFEKINEKFKKLQDERKKLYNYEDDKYIIRVPETLDEISKEGIALNHCVGGYINKHAEGSTNIIFLRKKACEDVPFYTIEVKNGEVIQIHGKFNKWLGNDPDAIPSVFKWIKEKRFNYEKEQLLNLGTGYCKSSKNLSEELLAF